jgi:hypothetical protein
MCAPNSAGELADDLDAFVTEAFANFRHARRLDDVIVEGSTPGPQNAAR